MNTRDKVVDIIIEELAIPKNEINDNSSLVKDFNVDALDLTNLTIGLEAEFGITIEDECRQNWIKVSDVVKYIEEATKK